MQYFVCLYLVPLLLQRIGNLLTYVAALFVTIKSELSRVRGADARTGDSRSGRRSDIATAKILFFKACFNFFL